jgi:hypothetical protein
VLQGAPKSTDKKSPGILVMPGVITGGTECHGGHYVYDHPITSGLKMSVSNPQVALRRPLLDCAGLNCKALVVENQDPKLQLA